MASASDRRQCARPSKPKPLTQGLRVDPREDAQEGSKLPQGRKVFPKKSYLQRNGPSETAKSRYSRVTHPSRGWWPINHSDLDLDSAAAYRMLEDAIEFVSQILTTGNLGVEPHCTVLDQRRLHIVRTL
ncbi:glutamyl-tRNA(Gln) amidotransferase subunit C-2, mitochondrial-like [Culex quinquefasciatus]|uniref:glutamyl-tRNA(Gln) amidotransferase subunit C-2, mitochondrial-like n=1 Tax=Culex quinquefasciatus TaxID=7176 RepID=UPI0018E3F2FD|nr:glutamyl-tRNA(Gln) amidotransferase subunit C-2, mitochondrial-like [Culex quinquefasciatus]